MHRFFRSALTLFAALLLLPLSSACAAHYSDTDDHWAGEQIHMLSERYGLLSGYDDGTFRPDRYITRAELAVVLNRLFDYREAAENRFSDISSDDWYADAILRLNAAGVFQGDGSFANPLANVTRQEAVSLIARAFGVNSAPGKPSFSDAADISAWAVGYVSAMERKGLVHGNENFFRPFDPLTRAEAVTILANILSDIDAREEAARHENEILYRGEWIPKFSTVPVSTYDPAQFYRDESNVLRYGDGSVPYWIGVDISSWQDEIDYHTLRNDGVDFVMLRLGYRGYTVGNLNLDEDFEDNLRRASDAGLKVGAYFFSQAVSVEEAQEEADFVLAQLDGRKLDYPIVFDWELVSSKDGRANDLDKDTLCACANTFCDAIAGAGYTPMVYFNIYTAYMRYDLDRLHYQDFWVAEYKDIPSFFYDFAIWQYTDSGKLDGVYERLDMNISFRDYSA